MKELTHQWVMKAENDFKIASKEMKSDDPIYDAICFHSQQCVEKYLKAILQENDHYIGKIHDLWKIAKDCILYLREVQEFKEKLVNLSEYAVEVRYPGVETTEEEARESFETCKEIRRLVRKYFGLEVENG